MSAPEALAQLATGRARAVRLALRTGELAALQAGEPDAPAVLLVPGYTGSKEDFGPILDPIAAAGFFVTALDLPGQYQSAPGREAADYRPAALGGVLLEVIGLLGRAGNADGTALGGVHLLGHSFGGLVTRAAMLAEGGPARIRSLVLMDSGPAALPGRRRVLVEHLAPVLAAGGLGAVYAAMGALAAATPGYVPAPPALAEFLQRRFLAGDPLMLQAMGDALLAEPDLTDRLGKALADAGRPALVLYGVDDDAWPPEQQIAMAALLGARTVAVAAAAHSPAIENPDATASALIDFWRAAG